MKGKLFYYSILLVICQSLAVFGVVVPAFAGVNDFYFEEFSADYYLARSEDGISVLRVKENLTAEFPDFEQNKGICRYVPFTNQGGANVTLTALNTGNISVLRNGVPEPIYSIEKQQDFYEVCTGDESYVLGEQVYTLEYEFEKTVTDFGTHQELYWDTNGNGWSQKFDLVVARVHVDEELLPSLTGEAWCYVGKYGESGQERCEILRTEDGFEFTAQNLARGENLTFDIEIAPGTFVVPEPEDNYFYVAMLGLVIAGCVLSVVWSVRKYLKMREKEQYYKGIFVKPEYQPHAQYNLEEMAEVYIGKKNDIKVAMLLDMVVRKKISLVKGEKKKWSIVIKSLVGVTKAEQKLLEILNGGGDVSDGDEIEIKRRTATTALVNLNTEFRVAILGELKKDGLVEKGYTFGNNTSIVASLILGLLVYVPVTMIFVSMGVFFLVDFSAAGRYVLPAQGFYTLSFWLVVASVAVVMVLNTKRRKFEEYTKKGLEMVRYMEGLRLYIKMAEKDRIEFLQSVEKADVSSAGIVKLYEKLLPYAAVFGLEKSWMREMEEYCQVHEVEAPDYLMTGVMASQIANVARSAAGYATSSTVMSSSGGGSSSGWSGGGGGGFSGGGGGGGGGGGR